MRFAALVCVATASLLARPAFAQMGPEAQAEVEGAVADFVCERLPAAVLALRAWQAETGLAGLA